LDFAGAAAELSCAAGAPFEPLSGLDESSPAGGVWLPLVGTDSVVGSGSPGGDSGSSVGSLVGVSDVGLSVVLDGGSHVGGEEGGTLVGSVVVASAGDVSEVVVGVVVGVVDVASGLGDVVTAVVGPDGAGLPSRYSAPAGPVHSTTPMTPPLPAKPPAAPIAFAIRRNVRARISAPLLGSPCVLPRQRHRGPEPVVPQTGG